MQKGFSAVFSVFLLVVIILLFTACSTASTDNGRSDVGNLFNIVSVDGKELLIPAYDEQDSSAEIVAVGANDFALRLGAELLRDSGDENFVYSPYSVWMPLAALVNATDNQNKPALLAALGASGIGEQDINKAASRMLYSLTKLQNADYEEYYNPLKIANAIFVGNDVTLKNDFAQLFMDFYRGNVMNVDFSSRDAVDAVNAWASKNTDGLIPDIVQEFDPLTVAAIANAIYFSDRWEWEFDAGQTEENIFHSPAGDVNAWFMLREGDGQTYYEDEKVQAMPLRFKNGGGMYIILPKSGNAADLLSSMTGEYFNKIQRDSIQASGKLLLPRFSVENDIGGLKEALEALGVPLFDIETAPLTGGLIEENIHVWLSAAMQKAIIEVDEKGTTAAAVTVMAISGSGMPMPTEPFEMVCDRPFAFILYDYTFDGGNQILFTGILNQP